MNKDQQLEQIIKGLYEGFSGAALASPNKDGPLSVEIEEQSDYSFIVFDEERDFEILLRKFEGLGYSFDLDTFHGLIPTRDLIKVDIANKNVKRPMAVSVNHHRYLRQSEFIIMSDAMESFDEIVVKMNDVLAGLLHKYQKN